MPFKCWVQKSWRLSLNSMEGVSSRMLLTSHEEIGRVGRVGRGCYDYEDPPEDLREEVGRVNVNGNVNQFF